MYNKSDKSDITNKPSLNSMHFFNMGDVVSSANICEFTVNSILNMSRRPARRDPTQIGARRPGRHNHSTWLAERPRPIAVPSLHAATNEWSLFMHQDTN